jgi:uncharacterized protein (TIGR03067 family)
MRAALASGLLVLSLLVSASLRADEKPLKGDLARLQGRWLATIGPEGAIPLVMEIKGDELSMLVTTFQGRGYTIKGQVKLDESSQPSRKTMDWTKLTANGKEGPDVLSLYDLEGDTLKICSAGPGKDRPTSFAPEKGNGAPARNLVFKREKDETKESTKTSSR